jgi:trimeric autotransporter adhesin
MAPQYGEVRVDYITYTTGVVPNEGTATAYVSGLINNPTFSGNVIIEGDATIDGNLNVSGDINASGVVISGITGLFDAGTEALPSIAFALDPNTGIYNPSANEVGISTDGNERLRVDNTGNVGIGTTSPSETLEVAGNTILDASNATLKIKQGVTGTTGAIDFTLNSDSTSYGSLNLVYDDRITQGLRLNTTYPLTLECGASEEILFKRTTTESARIDSSGRLLIGTSTAFPVRIATTAITPKQQLAGLSGTASTFVQGCASTTDSTAAFHWFAKFASGTINNNTTVVNANETLGTITWSGSDGTNQTQAAHIRCEVDGTPGANDMPGCLVFSTTADGASTPTERMRIKSNGNVGIGTSSPQATLDVNGDALINNLTVGLGAGSVSTNTAVGRNALQGNTTGQFNTAVGQNALLNNTTGEFNTAVGRSTLLNNTIGEFNNALGQNALLNNTEGNSNTAIGQDALEYNTTGSHNTAVGRSALNSNTTGQGNIGIGGRNSAGTYAPVFNPTTESNRIVMGSTSVTNAYVQVAWTVTSDARDKTNFASVPYGLDFVKQLEPTAYQFKAGTRGLRDPETNELIPVTAADELPSGPVRYGFKAQDILALEGDNPVIIDNEDPDHLRYRGEALVPVLVNAIKEQQVLIDALTARLDAAGIA